MSSISNVGNAGGNWPVQNVQKTSASQAPQGADAASSASPNRGADKLTLSGVNHLLKTLKANSVRADKVSSIKAQIQSGTYEDNHKLDVATDRLLDDLLK